MYGGGQAAALLAGTFLGYTWAGAAFGVTGGAAVASSGVALGVTNTIVANPHASYFEIGAGAATGAMNPFGEAVSSAAGLAGGGLAHLNGGNFRSGFVAGSIVGGLVGGGLDDYARALGKFSRGLQGADDLLAVQNATSHALRYTAASAGLGIAGGAVGYGLGGTNGALMGASLGSAMANFAVACFTAGTPIVVDLDGNSRAVDELEVGDLVLARSEFDPAGSLELKRVEEKFVRTSVVMELVVRGRSIKTTVEHPLYVPAQNDFVPAGQIQAGDHLISHDGELVQVDAVHSTDEVTTVYNLRVADHHTYFVGGTIWGWDVWVHNAIYVLRGDATPYNEINNKGWRKAFINENGDLEPASVVGRYQGRPVSVAQHVAGGRNRGAKANSPYISWSQHSTVTATFGGSTHTLTLDLSALKSAIRNGEVQNVSILTPAQVQHAIASNTTINAFARRIALSNAKKNSEYLTRGVIPQRFFRVDDAT